MKSLIYRILSSHLLSFCIGSMFRGRIPSFRGWIHVLESTSKKNKTAILLGIYEFPERLLIKKYLKKSLPVIECGASLGVVTRTIQKTISNNQKIIALEPNPNLQDVLKKNTAQGNFAKVFIEEAALGDGTESSFSVSDDNLASSLTGEGKIIQARTMRLFDVMEKHCLKTYSLIVDIEGYEHALIEKQAEYLKAADTIVIEIHGEETLVKNFISKASILGFDHIDRKHATHVFIRRGHL